MGPKQDTEIILGTGKLLGIFFVVVAICAVFFTMGFLLGRSSTPGSASTTIVSAVPSGGNPANKPSAGGGKTADAQNCPPGANNCPPAANGPDSSFYSSVNGKDSSTPQQPVTLVVPKAAATTPETTNPSPDAETKAAAGGSYMVQVAAVSKQEDADILVNALRKKEYAVFVANVPSDSLFHVQVGPFSDPKDAEAMRSRLASDGYNAIVKK
jgi:DedD protein